MGDGERKLEYLKEITKNTEIPITQFWPTHMNRNADLFKDAIEYGKNGGYVDFTTSTTEKFLEEGEVKCSKALSIMLENGVASKNITFTSDGQGSLPDFNSKGELVGLTVGKVESLYKEVRDAIIDEKIDISKAIRVITSNPADILKLSKKGYIKENNDADIVLLNKKDLHIDTVIANGKVMIQSGNILVKGTFEN